MDIRFNVTGAERKALVSAVGETLGVSPIYMKAPSFGYKAGVFTIDKNGKLSCGNDVDSLFVSKLMGRLAERGFVPVDVVGKIICQEAVPEITDRMTIEIPLVGFTETAFDNLEKLVSVKATLITKAIGADSLPIERLEDRLCFPWFPMTNSPEETVAYTHFVVALCEMAKKQKRVVLRNTEIDSEKFAMRCFLLRLGFIGNEYTAARKILLSKLSGSSAFKKSSH